MECIAININEICILLCAAIFVTFFKNKINVHEGQGQIEITEVKRCNRKKY